MKVTNTDNQQVIVKKKVEVFFRKAIENKHNAGFCITKDVMATLMDKWSLFVLYNLGYFEKMRFTELRKKINGISARMLSVTLKKLESNKIIQRKVFAEVPPKVEYRLTDFGLELVEKTVDMNEWFLQRYLEDKGQKKTPTSGGKAKT